MQAVLRCFRPHFSVTISLILISCRWLTSLLTEPQMLCYKHIRHSRWHFGVSKFTLEWLHCLRWKIIVSTETKFPPIISFMYNLCTLKINWCTLKINHSVKYFHIYQYTLLLDICQCPLKINFNQLPALCMIGRRKISVSVDTDFKNQCICSHWFSNEGVSVHTDF